jgi:hypothetical protein
VLQHILNKTESPKVVSRDVEIYFSSILILLSNENNAMKSKALAIFTHFMNVLKKSNENKGIESDGENM